MSSSLFYCANFFRESINDLVFKFSKIGLKDTSNKVMIYYSSSSLKIKGSLETFFLYKADSFFASFR